MKFMSAFIISAVSMSIQINGGYIPSYGSTAPDLAQNNNKY